MASVINTMNMYSNLMDGQEEVKSTATEELLVEREVEDGEVVEEVTEEVTAQATEEVVEEYVPHLDLAEYPVLGTSESQQQSSKIKGNKYRVKGSKFMVASSRIAELKAANRAQRPGFVSDPALAKLHDKEAMAKELKCTKPCQYVCRETPESDWGVCYREVCTFAHSKAELKLPPCAFGERCNRIHGSRDYRTGKVDHSRKCQFQHPGETADQFYTRTHQTAPDLPETSEKTHQPKKRETKNLGKPAKKLDLTTDTRPATETAPADVEPELKPLPLVRHNAVGMRAWQMCQQTEKKPTIIRVPAAMAEMAMAMAISRGLSDFQILVVE